MENINLFWVTIHIFTHILNTYILLTEITYTRTLDKEKLVVLANFSKETVHATLEDEKPHSSRVLISNYERDDALLRQVEMRPYEAVVYKVTLWINLFHPHSQFSQSVIE